VARVVPSSPTARVARQQPEAGDGGRNLPKERCHVPHGAFRPKMTKLNTKSPLQAYAPIVATFVVESLHRLTGCRSGVDRRSFEQRPRSLVEPCIGEGEEISGPIGAGNRTGPHTHKISCGRTIDFFKKQSKKSMEISGGRRKPDGVGGLHYWAVPHCWNPPSYAQIFFVADRIFIFFLADGIFGYSSSQAARPQLSNVESNQRFHRDARGLCERMRIRKLHLFSGALSLLKAASKNCREIQGGGEGVGATCGGCHG
jgi:hypothetical protein